MGSFMSTQKWDSGSCTKDRSMVFALNGIFLILLVDNTHSFLISSYTLDSRPLALQYNFLQQEPILGSKVPGRQGLETYTFSGCSDHSSSMGRAPRLKHPPRVEDKRDREYQVLKQAREDLFPAAWRACCPRKWLRVFQEVSFRIKSSVFSDQTECL